MTQRTTARKIYLVITIWAFTAMTSITSGFVPRGGSFVQRRTPLALNTIPKRGMVRSTALSMNLFDRFARVAKANLSNVLKTLEEPEKILNQAIEDMQVRRM